MIETFTIFKFSCGENVPRSDADIISKIFSAERPNDFINTVNVGDSMEVLRNFPDESVDMVVTSPPYNFSMNYDVANDDLETERFFEGLDMTWRECFRVLKTNGRIAVVIKPNYSNHIDSHHIIVDRLKKIGFLWRMEIVWDTGNYGCLTTAWGSFKSPSCNYLRYTHEFIEILDKGGRKRDVDNYLTRSFHGKYDRNDLIDLTEKEFIDWTKGIWNIPPETNPQVRRGHPAVFPEELPRRLIKLNTYIGDIVLDPFVGTGTTLKVAAMRKRFSIGIDISENYCDIAMDRVSRVQRQSSLVGDFQDDFPAYRKVKW
jgi:site-specific DNA-methyltransferase (adenine-specific)